MTAIIVAYERQKVAIAADALLTKKAADGSILEWGLMSKIFPAPHLNAVLVGSGWVWLTAELNTWLNVLPKRPGSFDALAAEMKAELTRLAERFRALKAAPDGLARELWSSAHLLGWDEATGGFGYYLAETNFATAEVEMQRLDGPCVVAAPSAGLPQPMDRRMRHPGDFLDLMKRQREHEQTKPAGRQAHIGGDVILFEMWRAKMTWARIGALPLPGAE